MRRRAKRDLSILGGIVVILAILAFVNYNLNRGALASEMDKWRRKAEKSRIDTGMPLLSWQLLRQTTGRPRTGGTFAEELKPYDNKVVNIIGFMVPNEKFRDVTEFMFLPLPIECYFCNIPPPRDVLYVTLQKDLTVQIAKEPALITGLFHLHQGPDQKFFYTITDGTIKAAEEGGELTQKRLNRDHMLGGPVHEASPDELLDPVSTPKDSD